jgi:hypothetical protein
MRVISITVAAAALCMAAIAAQSPAPTMFHGRSLLNAHNAYPDEGQWKDRFDRAMATGSMPIVIEQDVAYDPQRGAVVSHDAELDGSEPTL